MLTRHGETRLAKRSGVGRKATEKLAAEALAGGLSRDDAKGNLRRYLDRQYFTHSSAFLKVYCGNVYVFRTKEGPLVTMFSLPGNLKHAKAARSAT